MSDCAGSRHVLPFLLVVGAALAASLPLLRPGLPATHDGLFHLYRIFALDEAVNCGCFYPRWFPSFAFGYGQPVLSFYSPALYYLAESLKLSGIGALAALELSVALGFLFSGASAYGLARTFARPWPAALAGACYILFPYRLANVYVRGAFAEHWGLALLPFVLLLTARLRSIHRQEVAILAFGWATLILTHNLVALISAAIWIVYVFLHFWKRWKTAVQVFLALPLGAILSAFYWLPIPWEARVVGLGNTFSTDAWERYLAPLSGTLTTAMPYLYYPEQLVQHEYPVSLTAGMLGALSIACLLLSLSRLRHHRNRRWLWFFLFLVLACWFLQTNLSALLWRCLPLLGFIQFPWRLLGVMALAWAMLLAYGLDALAVFVPCRKVLLPSIAIVVSCLIAYDSLYFLPEATEDTPAQAEWTQHMWTHDASIGQVGATWTAEYVPVWVTVDRSAMPLDPVETDRPPVYSLPVNVKVEIRERGYNSIAMIINTPEPVRLSWHTFYFPGWQAAIDGIEVEPEPFTDMGLVSLSVAAGEHEVSFRFSETLLRAAVRALSAVSALVVVLLLAGNLRLFSRVVLALLAGAVLWGATGCYPNERPVSPLWLPFEGKMALAGWDAPSTATGAGSTLSVNLYWLALATPEDDYKVFLHLATEEGTVVAQSDGDPVGGFTHALRLVGGEILEDRRYLEIPQTIRPGRYALYAGLYRWPEMVNLTVSGGDQVGSQRPLLGWVEIR